MAFAGKYGKKNHRKIVSIFSVLDLTPSRVMPGKGLWYPLDKRRCGIYSQSGHYEDKNSLPLLGIKCDSVALNPTS
jgi:hypothetical protein